MNDEVTANALDLCRVIDQHQLDTWMEHVVFERLLAKGREGKISVNHRYSCSRKYVDMPSTCTRQDVSSVPNGFVAQQRYVALSDVTHEVISSVHTP
jgi:ribose 1,5-bisphosphokinase PhnN